MATDKRFSEEFASETELVHSITFSISRLERHRRKYINEQLTEYDLKGSMFLALLNLSHNPGSSQDRLCSDLLIDKGNAARMCRQLEEMGYIRREQSPEDRRQNMLFLTEKGEEQLPRIRSLLTHWSGTATTGLTREEELQLSSLLRRMLENLQEQGL